jgi:hypothetical protein
VARDFTAVAAAQGLPDFALDPVVGELHVRIAEQGWRR